VQLGRRQISELAMRAATDLEQFYATRDLPAEADTPVLGLSFDAKGIVMRPDALTASAFSGHVIGDGSQPTRPHQAGWPICGWRATVMPSGHGRARESEP
jgi:hypothetical protein